MKKLIALVMTLICVLCLVACSSSNTDNTTPNTETINNPVMEEPAPLHETEPSTNTTKNLNDIIPMVMVRENYILIQDARARLIVDVV